MVGVNLFVISSAIVSSALKSLQKPLELKEKRNSTKRRWSSTHPSFSECWVPSEFLLSRF